jgi:hypothetical protein
MGRSVDTRSAPLDRKDLHPAERDITQGSRTAQDSDKALSEQEGSTREAEQLTAPVGKGNLVLPNSGDISTTDAGPIQSDNLGDNGILGEQDNADTSATGPRGVPSVGNYNPAGTGNTGNAGLDSPDTAIESQLGPS